LFDSGRSPLVEMFFDLRQTGNQSTRDNLLKLV